MSDDLGKIGLSGNLVSRTDRKPTEDSRTETLNLDSVRALIKRCRAAQLRDGMRPYDDHWTAVDVLDISVEIIEKYRALAAADAVPVPPDDAPVVHAMWDEKTGLLPCCGQTIYAAGGEMSVLEDGSNVTCGRARAGSVSEYQQIGYSGPWHKEIHDKRANCDRRGCRPVFVKVSGGDGT